MDKLSLLREGYTVKSQYSCIYLKRMYYIANPSGEGVCGLAEDEEKAWVNAVRRMERIDRMDEARAEKGWRL